MSTDNDAQHGDSPTSIGQDDDAFDPVADLVDCLNLRPLGSTEGGPGTDIGEGGGPRDVFVGRSQPQPTGRAFGGQVLAQSIIAAGRTVADVDGPPRFIHSLHGYFLRPGDSKAPIEFRVERMRDGRSFSARRVHAMQRGEILLSMITSFQTEADGMDHQDTFPPVPLPESRPSTADLVGHLDHDAAQYWARRRAIDIRHCEQALYLGPPEQKISKQHVWLKALSELPDDPLLHAAVLAYASDYTLLEAALRRHGICWTDPRLRPASLDHAMWFHRPCKVDDWILYAADSPSASNGRGLGTGRMFARSGELVATVAQEGMIRLKDTPSGTPQNC